MNRDPIADEVRYLELGAFLRSRRERLTPREVGLPQGSRRRTPGLRREEVAFLAGVGTTWYTWLEQGREVRASEEVLLALADALRLDASERQHLFVLSDRTPPIALPNGPERVEASLQRMLDSLIGQPAYVTGRRWDVLAWNRAAVALFGDYGQLQGDERNIMHLVFANPAHRRLLLDWDTLAPVALAMFRADSARYLGDPDFSRLIALLGAKSVEFSDWWLRHEVLERHASAKRILHPQQGRMNFEHMSFALSDGSDRRLTLYTPMEEDGTIKKLQKLLATVAPCP